MKTLMMTALLAGAMLVLIPLFLCLVMSLIIRHSRLKYEHDILYFENALINSPVNYGNYLFLYGEIDRIMQRNNLDRGRTKKAYAAFLRKYIDFVNEEVKSP